MKINVSSEGDIIFLSYADVAKEKLEYGSLERMIEYLMENDINDATAEGSEECAQYVSLINKVIEKTKTDDFKRCYQNAHPVSAEQPSDDEVTPE